MSNTTSRFNVENFDPPPDEELICSICRCIFDDPMECPCRHIFCRSCISSWLNLKRSCPICRKHVYALDLQSVVPLIKNLIAKLTMKCPNRENGCKSKINLENFNFHVSHCLHEMIQCKNKNCSCTFFRKDIERHEKVECEYRMVMCESECKLMLPLAKVKHHNCIKELLQQLEDSSKREESLNKHIEELTNELNTLKKKSVETRRNPSTPSFFSFFSSDDGSSSYGDSFFSMDSDDYMLGSHSSNFNLGLFHTDPNNNRRNDERDLSTVSERPRSTDSDVDTSSDGDSNSNQSIDTTSDTLTRDQVFHIDFDDFINSSDSSSSFSVSSSATSHSIPDSTEGEDDEFPTLAQRRILKRKRSSSVVSVSSESDQGDTEVRSRRRRSGEQGSNQPDTSNANHDTVNNCKGPGHKSKSKAKKTNSRIISSTPRSIVPVEVPSHESSQSSSLTQVSPARANGLERTRELLELFSVETDPDWEPSEESTTSEGEEIIRSVPAADLLDSMLGDENGDGASDVLSVTDLSEEDENYEVLVPERTFDLLYRYTQEDSEDDEEWLPHRLRSLKLKDAGTGKHRRKGEETHFDSETSQELLLTSAESSGGVIGRLHNTSADSASDWPQV